MSQKKLVSIVCTAYNHEKYIRSALDGFVRQKTNFPFEVIVHDDASTDNTAKIIKEYQEKYPDLIVPILQTENQYSKKVMIDVEIIYPIAKGKYIAFCEGDDFWIDENKLQMQVDFLEKNPEYTACVHNTVMHDCTGKSKDKLVVNSDKEHDVEFEQVVWGMQNAYQTSALVVKKEALLNVPEFCKKAYKNGFGDLPNALWFTIIGKIYFMPKVMSTYRLMSSETSWSLNTYATQRYIKHIEHLIDMFEEIKTYVSNERIELLNKVILFKKFDLLELSREYKKMTKPIYDEVWCSKSLFYKIKFYVKKYVYWFYKK